MQSLVVGLTKAESKNKACQPPCDSQQRCDQHFIDLLQRLKGWFGNLLCREWQIHLFEAWKKLLVAQYWEGKA